MTRRAQSPLVKRLGELLRRVRVNAGLTQADCAVHANVTIRVWRGLERCRQKDIGLVTFMCAAKGLNLSATQLMALLEESTPSAPKCTPLPRR